ncbi:unnamed protein product [Chrysoparadoxa australica]
MLISATRRVFVGQSGHVRCAVQKARGVFTKPDNDEETSKIHDRKAMFDSAYADGHDDKTFKDVNKEVKTDTPDATRISFGSAELGKVDVSDEAAAIAAELAKNAPNAPNPGVPISKVHDPKAMFDSAYGLVHDDKTSEDVKREVKADTPDATRISFGSAELGKVDVSDEAAAIAAELAKNAPNAPNPGVPISKVHDPKAMFDSAYGLVHDDKTSEDVKREVKADTPDATRISFGSGELGKVDVSDEAAAIAAELAKKNPGAGSEKAPISKVSDHRAMFDSDYIQSGGGEKDA